MESFRSFRGPIFQKQVSNRSGTFFAVSYSKPALLLGWSMSWFDHIHWCLLQILSQSRAQGHVALHWWLNQSASWYIIHSNIILHLFCVRTWCFLHIYSENWNLLKATIYQVGQAMKKCLFGWYKYLSIWLYQLYWVTERFNSKRGEPKCIWKIFPLVPSKISYFASVCIFFEEIFFTYFGPQSFSIWAMRLKLIQLLSGHCLQIWHFSWDVSWTINVLIIKF